MTENARSLRAIRNELGISRERLARKTENLSSGTIRNAEFGRHRVTLDKAGQILAAINCLLSEAQKPVVSMDDLNIRLY